VALLIIDNTYSILDQHFKPYDFISFLEVFEFFRHKNAQKTLILKIKSTSLIFLPPPPGFPHLKKDNKISKK
jgi:hypothetical protein